MIVGFLAVAAMATPACPILRDPDGFRPRGVRKQDDEWTADIFLTTWVPDAIITIVWPGPRDLISANHADVREIADTSATIALQKTGPDNVMGGPSANNIMLHVRGTHSVTPQILCTLPPGTNIPEQLPPPVAAAAAAPAVAEVRQPDASAHEATTAAARWAAGAGAPTASAPLALSASSHGVTVTASSGHNSHFAWSAPTVAKLAAAAHAANGLAVAAAPGGIVAANEVDLNSLPCATDHTELSLYQMTTDAAAGVGYNEHPLACDQVGRPALSTAFRGTPIVLATAGLSGALPSPILVRCQVALRLPAARLCSAGETLSLLWLQPGQSLWTALQESLPSAQVWGSAMKIYLHDRPSPPLASTSVCPLALTARSPLPLEALRAPRRLVADERLPIPAALHARRRRAGRAARH